MPSPAQDAVDPAVPFSNGEQHWHHKVSLPIRPPATMPAALSETELDAILQGASTFSFHFQPIVDLQRGSAVGFEALARFSVSGNRIPPNLVFEAAGDYGRRLDLEEKVLTEAVAAKCLLPPTASSPSTLAPGFLLSDRFDRLLRDATSLRGVVFEITEDEVITDYSVLHKKLALIRERGGFAAVDDARIPATPVSSTSWRSAPTSSSLIAPSSTAATAIPPRPSSLT